MVLKFRYGGFAGTSLDFVLCSLGRQTAICAGVSTNACVEAAAREAFSLDYYVVIPEDACASWGMSLHDATLATARQRPGWPSRSVTVDRACGQPRRGARCMGWSRCRTFPTTARMVIDECLSAIEAFTRPPAPGLARAWSAGDDSPPRTSFRQPELVTCVTGCRRRAPVWLRAEPRDLVALPYSLELNDSVIYATQKALLRRVLSPGRREGTRARFGGNRRARVLTLPLHPICSACRTGSGTSPGYSTDCSSAPTRCL